MSLLAADTTLASDPAAELLDLIRDMEAAAGAGPAAESIGQLRGRAIQLLAAHPSGRKDRVSVLAACRVVELALTAGWVDRPASETLLAEAAKAHVQNWTGLLVALLLAPAWQMEELPAFEAAPLFLWRTLALAYFRVPAAITELGQADAMARRQTQSWRELARMAEFNPGAAALREAAAVALQPVDLRPLSTAAVPLHEALIARGRLHAALHRRPAGIPFPTLPRSGRRLKLGVVIEELTNDRRWRAILPWFDSLDAGRCEVIVFFTGQTDATAESYLTAREISYRRLLGDAAQQNLQLQSEGLDIALCSLPAPGVASALPDLFVERFAPLQGSFDELGLPSERKSFDVTLQFGPAASFWPTAAGQRLVVPVTGGRVLAAGLKGRLGQTWARADLGFLPESVIYASVAPFALLSPEWADAAAARLRDEPLARLLVHSGAPEDAGVSGVNRVCAVLEPALQRHRVEVSRVLISNEPLGSLAEIQSLLGLADFYLESFPLGDAEGRQLARDAGIPTVGQRPGAHAEFHDPVAFGEAVTVLLETAFDCVAADDSGKMLRQSAALTLELKPIPEGALEEPAILLESGLAAEALPRLSPWFIGEPSHPRARSLFYSALIGAGQARRAMGGLNTAIGAQCADAGTWRLLARAHLALGAREAAMNALRTCLKLDPQHAESWAVLTEIAEAGGHHLLSEEIARLRAALTEQTAAAAPPATGRCLYFSPVGKSGIAILRQIVDLFPAEQFDFLIVGYDETDFSDLAGRIELIRDRGQKWRLIKQHLTPERVAAYDYVFMWDDDILPVSFDPVEFVSILRRNRVDIAQASLTTDSYSFHPITVVHPNPVGRLTNFVEIMCPVYSSKIWPSIYPYIEPDVNEMGWGYDLIPLGRKAIVDCMTVRHTRPGQSALQGAAQQGAAWAQRHRIKRPALVNLWNLT